MSLRRENEGEEDEEEEVATDDEEEEEDEVEALESVRFLGVNVEGLAVMAS